MRISGELIITRQTGESQLDSIRLVSCNGGVAVVALVAAGRAGIDGMAFGAVQSPMDITIHAHITTSGMREGGIPIRGGMAGCAVWAIPAMAGRFGMTTGAIRRKPGENAAGMALRAAQAGVSAGQRKPGQAVVIAGGYPTGRGVAGVAIVAKTRVGCSRFVAGAAAGGSFLKDAIFMAALTQ